MEEEKKEVGLGKVRRVFESRGFLFIAQDNGSDDLFGHFSNIEEWEILNPGTLVEYEIGKSRDGRKQALNVRKLKLDAD